MTKLSKSIIDQIQQKQVKPKPAWYFYAKNFAFWGTYMLAILVGGLAISLVLLGGAFGMAPGFSWEHMGHLVRFFITVIAIWGGVGAGGISLAVWGFHHTRNGYKVTSVTLILTNILISFVLGVGLFVTRGTIAVERAIARHITVFPSVEKRFHDFAVQPEDGRIMGVIAQVDAENAEAVLVTPEGDEWILELPEKYNTGVLGEFSEVHVFASGEKIQIEDGETVFRVNEIIPTEAMHKRFIENGPEFLDRKPEIRKKVEQRVEKRKERRKEHFESLPPEIQNKLKEIKYSDIPLEERIKESRKILHESSRPKIESLVPRIIPPKEIVAE